MWILLILIALIERLVFDFGPNIELVTAVTVVAGIYLSRKYQILIPLLVMMISDVYLGWGTISFFTWTGFIVMGLGVGRVRKFTSSKYRLGLGSALMGNLGFYLWTNFGVWVTEQWGMYENTLSGLGQSYLMGLPFLKMQLYSSLVFVPILIFLVELGILVRGKKISRKLISKWLNFNKNYLFLRR